PSARHYHLGSVGFRLLKLTFPTLSAQQLGTDLLYRHRKDCLQELVSMFADRVLGRPPVQLLRPSIPVGDDVTHVTDKNGVMGKMEQAGVLGSSRHFRLEVVAGLPKVLLDPASPGAEPADHECK